MTDAGLVRSTLWAWVELARLSNVPTVWSNVIAGAALGWTLSAMERQEANGFQSVGFVGVVGSVGSVGLIAASISLLYIGGMILNDAADATIDRLERPDRPIPRGTISRAAAWSASVALLATGLALTTTLGSLRVTLATAALTLCIIAYDLLHTRSRWTMLLMGACRGLIYITAAVAFDWSTDVAWVVIIAAAAWLAAYIVAVTWVARNEAREEEAHGFQSVGLGQWSAWLCIAWPLLALGLFIPRGTLNLIAAAVIGVITLTWLTTAATRLIRGRQHGTTIRHGIMMLLSGIALLDAWLLTLLGQPILAAIALACWALTVWGHRRIAGT